MGLSIQHPLYPKPAFDETGTIIASQSTTVTGAAAAATAFSRGPTPVTGGYDLVTFDVQGGAVRVRWGGTAPTATVGHFLPANSAYTWDAAMFANSLFILDTSAASATIFASPLQA